MRMGIRTLTNIAMSSKHPHMIRVRKTDIITIRMSNTLALWSSYRKMRQLSI